MHKAAFWYDIVQRKIVFLYRLLFANFERASKYLVDVYLGKKEWRRLDAYVNKVEIFDLFRVWWNYTKFDFNNLENIKWEKTFKVVIEKL